MITLKKQLRTLIFISVYIIHTLKKNLFLIFQLKLTFRSSYIMVKFVQKLKDVFLCFKKLTISQKFQHNYNFVEVQDRSKELII